MAENGNPENATTTDDAGNPGGEGDALTLTVAPDVAGKWPEKFRTDGAPDIGKLLEGHASLEKRLGEGAGKEQREKIIAEHDAERLKNRPESPDKYETKLPGELGESIVFLDAAPGDDFKPEDGKAYLLLNNDDPMMQFWRDTCHKAGFGQDEFQQGLALFAQKMALAQPTAEDIKKQHEAVFEALGEHGKQRVGHAWAWLNAQIGEEHAEALNAVLGTPESVQAIEALMEKTGAPRFQSESVVSSEDRATLEAEARKIMGEPDYYESKEKQARVAEIYRKIHPGKRSSQLRPSFAA